MKPYANYQISDSDGKDQVVLSGTCTDGFLEGYVAALESGLKYIPNTANLYGFNPIAYFTVPEGKAVVLSNDGVNVVADVITEETPKDPVENEDATVDPITVKEPSDDTITEESYAAPVVESKKTRKRKGSKGE